MKTHVVYPEDNLRSCYRKKTYPYFAVVIDEVYKM